MIINTLAKAVLKATDEHKKGIVSAVILAAGAGSRMGSTGTKQMMNLCGIPLIVRTVLAFDNHPDIDEIIIAAREEEMPLFKQFFDKYGIKKVKSVVKGGATRQESAFLSLKKINPDCRFILIHDGARPLVTEQNITDVIAHAVKYNCATAACRSKDTVKISTALGYIESTPDRNTVFYAQTPQAFRAEIYRAAAYTAQKDGFVGTDDCSLVENIGFKIKLVDCGYENIKITTPQDIFVAEQILKSREKK